MINSHFNNLNYRTKNCWRSIDAHFQDGAARVFLSLLGWNMANTPFMMVCMQSPSRLLMMQDQKSLTRHWLSCLGWGKERVSLVFSYKGGWFIRKGQWCAKVNILRLTVGYLNATINRKTRNTELDIGTDGSSQTRQHPRVDRYGFRFGPPRCCWSGVWTVLEQNRTVFPVRTRTAGRLPGPVANTTAYNLAELWFPRRHDQKSLTLRWRSFCHGCIHNMQSFILAQSIIHFVLAAFLAFSFTFFLITTLFFNNT